MDPKDTRTPGAARQIALTEELLPSRLPIYVTTRSLEERGAPTLLDTMDATLASLEKSEPS